MRLAKIKLFACALTAAVMLGCAPIAFADSASAQGSLASGQEEATTAVVAPSLSASLYKTSWKTAKWNEISGTEAGYVTLGDNTKKRTTIKAVKISLNAEGAYAGSSIEYRVRQNGSWRKWCSDGDTAGNKKRSIEAIQVRLVGSVASTYCLHARARVTNMGWLDWTLPKSGGKAGCGGKGNGISALQLQLVPQTEKGECASNHKGEASMVTTDLVQLKVSGKAAGKVTTVGCGEICGKKAKNLARMRITSNKTVGGKIKYALFPKGAKTWSGYKSGEWVGHSGKGASGMKIKLAGRMAEFYDVYYRVYIKGYGWMGWAKDGQLAGTTALKANITSFQVQLVLNGTKAPGSTANHKSKAGGTLKEITYRQKLIRKAASVSSSTGYKIVVDTHVNRVGIFKKKGGSWVLFKYFACTSGAPWSPTVKGTFHTGSKGVAFGSGYTCWYYTQIYGNYLFHSVLYNPGSKSSIQDGRLGINASHGCVRLAIGNAHWIYRHIPYGTTVRIY